MKARGERGVALIMVLIMLGILSVLGASLIFVSQSETWSSQNYRLMTEARYGAESGVNKAANFLINSYAAPGTAGDPMTGYSITTSPVRTSGGAAVVLSSLGYGSTYPVASVKTDFENFVHGTLTTGTDLVTYDAIATLQSMRQVTVYGSATPVTVQTWQIVGRGTIAGSKPARVDVTAILERQVEPMFAYAAFATADGCGSLTWTGGGATDSYDSSQLVGGLPVFVAAGGNVGTNGNLNQNGGPTIIQGSLSTPRTGVGTCETGAVTALTLSGSAPPTAGLVELPQPVVYPPPTPPSPAPSGELTVKNTENLVKNPGNYGDIKVYGTLHLTAGTYNINSITIEGGGAFYIDSGPVVLNVAGYSNDGDATSGYMGTPIDFTGQAIATNTGLDPSLFQITYAGTGTIKMAGGADTAGVLYAPNATVTNNSAGAQWFGAVIARTVTDAGHAVIHYDRHLQMTAMVVGPWMMDAFSWRKF